LRNSRIDRGEKMYKTLPIIGLMLAVVMAATLIPTTSEAIMGPIWMPNSGGYWGGFSGGCSSGCGGYSGYYGSYGYTGSGGYGTGGFGLGGLFGGFGFGGRGAEFGVGFGY
jgi:hypothetical protein